MTQANLVLQRGGDSSLHASYFALPGPARNWDFHLSYFGKTDKPWLPPGPGVSWSADGGSNKFSGVADCLDNARLDIAPYRYIALVDDDVLLTSDQISVAFSLRHAHQLAGAALSLNPWGFWEHAYTLRDPRFALRMVSRTEPIFGIFRADLLAALLPAFRLPGNGWAMDHVIAAHAGSLGPLAVLDAASLVHARAPSSGELYSARGQTHSAAEDEQDAFLAAHGYAHIGISVHAGLSEDGVLTHAPKLPSFRIAAARALRKLRARSGLMRIARADEGGVYVRARLPGMAHLKVDPTLR
jgi:hypothetical protein